MNPARVYLALLLAAQFIVPLVPSWGAFVPHDHWARTRLTPADWSAHVQEHAKVPVTATPAGTRTGEAKIISTLSQTGLTSFHAPLADHDPDFEFARVARILLHDVLAHEFTTRAVSYPPPDPPPTF